MSDAVCFNAAENTHSGNNIEGFISGAFPVLHRLIEASRWQRLVRSFIAEHQARTPYFLQISQEFLAWLQQGYVAEAGDPPFVLELAHYEWVELALDVSEAEPALLELAQQHGLRADTQYFNNAQIVLDDWQRQGIWCP
ncbi:Putative DNA-binding domain-containing protein [Pseudomonas cuatrocienegasensis]|uniref:DNA-binding domain-containing protein n=1 Tax=Pseudomonas cuatrocienegasensis TaxID=543360 RepID=A0ABY1AZV9_9PSED|nr:MULTISPECIES: putative DNA-binding domain-containing protein [Pseudomonas]OEC36203.1 hypothetical protein A7D25_06330 [Pseudomonas sp. 21C1]SEP60201.1 Putative DNA-binding domain-containing protein [Pseudomonas cuatrocienegasensis]